MLYLDLPLLSERGVPLDVACELDFEGLDPTQAGAHLLIHVRATRGDAAIVLELSSLRGEVVASPATGTSYRVALSKSAADMTALPHGVYRYGLMVSGAGAPAFVMAEGEWTHQAILVDAVNPEL